jgi:hypothetical protein
MAEITVKTIGFTGTSKGMTPEQKAQVREKLVKYKAEGYTHFRHGLCIGSDEQAAKIAKELGYYVVAHPGYSPKNPTSRLFRSDFDGNDGMRREKPFVKRDHDIVDESDCMIGTPLGPEETRSGTWTTLRYAKKKGKPRDIIYP